MVFRTIRSEILQPASAGKGGDMSELQAHLVHDTRNVNLAFVHCEGHNGKVSRHCKN